MQQFFLKIKCVLFSISKLMKGMKSSVRFLIRFDLNELPENEQGSSSQTADAFLAEIRQMGFRAHFLLLKTLLTLQRISI